MKLSQMSSSPFAWIALLQVFLNYSVLFAMYNTKRRPTLGAKVAVFLGDLKRFKAT